MCRTVYEILWNELALLYGQSVIQTWRLQPAFKQSLFHSTANSQTKANGSNRNQQQLLVFRIRSSSIQSRSKTQN